jgi:hypothetical protein
MNIHGSFVMVLLASSLFGQQTIYLPGQYSDLQSAINAAAPGSTIEISGSVPATAFGFGDVMIDKSLMIVGRPVGSSIYLHAPSAVSAPGQGGQLLIGSLTTS